MIRNSLTHCMLFLKRALPIANTELYCDYQEMRPNFRKIQEKIQVKNIFLWLKIILFIIFICNLINSQVNHQPRVIF